MRRLEETMAKHRIESDSLAGLAAALVFLLRRESPSIGKAQYVCLDGSKLTILVKDKHDPMAALRNGDTSGITIDGATPG